MTSPLQLHPAPSSGFDEPFEMLAACHERVERMLTLLEKLAAHLPGHGCDEQAVAAARDVMRYFDVAAPAHHEDEERHVLPALREAGDDAFAAQLEQEHREMHRRWQELRRNLLDVVNGTWTGRSAADFATWHRYAELYRGHAAAEDAHAFPTARNALGPEQLHAMGEEMASRRGLR